MSAPANGRSADRETILTITDLEVFYGHVRAVRGVDLQLRRGEICVILGANGAGKSSIIKSIIGLIKPRSGRIEFPVGNAIQGAPPHKINALGMAWVPEGRQIFANLSIRENLLIGGFRAWGDAELDERMQRIVELFPRLGERMSQLAGSLSGGEQQMLAFGRALMSDPQVLLLDEPSLGLAPRVVEMLFDVVAQFGDEGLSVIMAEQNARQALRISDYAYLLESGEMRGHGSAHEMREREDVRAAYLGG